jgi:predicted alpha/beta superfamily hydrolase
MGMAAPSQRPAPNGATQAAKSGRAFDSRQTSHEGAGDHMHTGIRRLLALSSGVAILAAAGLTSTMLAATSSSVEQVALAPAAPTIVNSASLATGPVPTTCAGPIVNANGTITFCLTAPQATNVALNFQHMLGASPAADVFAMTETASGGIWYVTVEPPAGPNWYGYNFTVDGAHVADPNNRNLWSGAATSFSAVGQWSMVMVPGPAADYMADTNVRHGAVSTVNYYSPFAGTEREMQVYTPPGYNSSARPYPVLYIMHGAGGNDTDWVVNMRTGFIMDNLIAAGKAEPMIVVMPDANVGASLNGEPTAFTSVVTDQFVQDELMPTIIPYMEANYRVLPGAQNRAIAGLSLGSANTRDAMFLDTDQFAYYGLFSWGFMTPAIVTDLEQNHPQLVSNVIKAEQNKRIKLLWISAGGEEISPGVFGSFITVPQTLTSFDQLGIKYTYVPGPEFGAIYGHVWDTWRKDLLVFAPQLFQH